MVNRLILNLQNPAIFEYNTRSQAGTLTTGTNLGPFLAHVPEVEVEAGAEGQMEAGGVVSKVEFTDGSGTTSSGTAGMLSNSTSSYSGSTTSTSASGSGSGSGFRSGDHDGARGGTRTPEEMKDGDEDGGVPYFDQAYGIEDGDDEDGWEARMPRRALWYNPEWVSGYQRAEDAEAGDGTEMSPVSSRRVRGREEGG